MGGRECREAGRLRLSTPGGACTCRPRSSIAARRARSCFVVTRRSRESLAADAARRRRGDPPLVPLSASAWPGAGAEALTRVPASSRTVRASRDDAFLDPFLRRRRERQSHRVASVAAPRLALLARGALSLSKGVHEERLAGDVDDAVRRPRAESSGRRRAGRERQPEEEPALGLRPADRASSSRRSARSITSRLCA